MATEFKENLDLVVGYTQKFIDAVTPVAKQAYETGLITLRIDAAADLVIAFLLLSAFLGMAYGCYLAGKKTEWDVDVVGPALVVTACFAVPMWICAIWRIFSVWVWVKLVSPDLWLAHQAVEKLLK